ncbi:ZIP family metal transporter [Crateriforma spongiae]|uniref:ZIP family metal transporter n=1 Tax=Crateriforma spongiae TaxID=2724528 RepID=UPI00144608C6|nr:ZIP family metal transporter [Crateriforma spongiae]
MNTFALLAVYCCLIAFVSLAGGRLTSLIRMTHLRTQLLMSGVGGLMLGIALLHLLPHATEILGSPSRAGTGALLGLTSMFLLIRLFHTHDHGVPAVDDSGESAASDGEGPDHSHGGSGCDHEPVCDHHHRHDHGSKGISWVGLFFGLLLHTLVDGVALSASVIAEADHGAWLGLAGLGTFLAVALHKPLDAFAITSVMNRQRWSVAAQWVANSLFSLACPVGAIAFYFGVSGLVDHPDLLGWGLAVSAGFFIGIALADLLPEVAFHDHDRGKLTLVFLLGIVVAFAVENLPGHSHDHGHSAGHQSAGDTHDHGQHDHSHAGGHSH